MLSYSSNKSAECLLIGKVSGSTFFASSHYFCFLLTTSSLLRVTLCISVIIAIQKLKDLMWNLLYICSSKSAWVMIRCSSVYRSFTSSNIFCRISLAASSVGKASREFVRVACCRYGSRVTRAYAKKAPWYAISSCLYIPLALLTTLAISELVSEALLFPWNLVNIIIISKLIS